MKEHPPFSGDKPRCVKCGYEGALTEWQEAQTLGTSILKPECLRRACARCGFQWDEATVPQQTQGATE